MPFYGTLDSLLEYRPLPTLNYFAAPRPADDDGGSLEALLVDKVQCLTDIVTDIDREIGSRVSLSHYVLYLISQHYAYLKTKLFELYTWQLGANRSIENRRSKLEQQLDALDQEKRQELVKAWQDIAALRKESRTWLKQYADLIQRLRLVVPDIVPRPAAPATMGLKRRGTLMSGRKVDDAP